MMPQGLEGQGGIKGPPGGVVSEGDPVPIEVQDEGGTTVTVLVHGDPSVPPLEVPIPKGGKMSIPPQPGWTAGRTLIVMTGNGPVRSILVEIISQFRQAGSQPAR